MLQMLLPSITLRVLFSSPDAYSYPACCSSVVVCSVLGSLSLAPRPRRVGIKSSQAQELSTSINLTRRLLSPWSTSSQALQQVSVTQQDPRCSDVVGIGGISSRCPRPRPRPGGLGIRMSGTQRVHTSFTPLHYLDSLDDVNTVGMNTFSINLILSPMSSCSVLVLTVSWS